MTIRLNEVHTTSIVLMALLTLMLIFFIPSRSKVGKVLHNTRLLLIGGTTLVAVHFIIQYGLHKFSLPSPEVRTKINILFGIPVGYFVNIAMLYLQRCGQVKTWEWLYSPVILTLSILIMSLSVVSGGRLISCGTALVIMAFLYASTLIVYHVLQVIEYFHNKAMYSLEKDNVLISLAKWSIWVILALIIVDTGLPVIMFSTQNSHRYIYGVFAVSIVFITICSFVFCVYRCMYKLHQEQPTNSADNEVQEVSVAIPERIVLTKEKKEEISKAADEMIKTGFYLKIGINMTDVAEKMGIQRSILTAWLLTTEYQQFNKWLMVLRIGKAKELLKEHPEWTNEAVSKMCGFSDRSYFQRQFRMVEGVTPAKWTEINCPKVENTHADSSK